MIGDIKKVHILIVEDEAILAQDIAGRLEHMGYAVKGIANTAEKALALLSEHPDIDIALLDIILKGDLDGIELARTINTVHHIPFLFLTSHADQHFVERAKSVNPYAYILKPFNDRQVSVAIELALVNFSKKTPQKTILANQRFTKAQNQVLHLNDSLFLKKDHHFERVPLKEILFLEAESNYTTIHTQSGRYVYSLVLKKIEALLPTELFVRIHRSFVININAVSGFGGNLLFVGSEKIPVSKSHKEDVFNLFHKL